MNEPLQPENILEIYTSAWQTMSDDAHHFITEILGIGYIEQKDFDRQPHINPLTKQEYQLLKAVEELNAIQVIEQAVNDDSTIIYTLIEEFKNFAINKIFFPDK